MAKSKTTITVTVLHDSDINMTNLDLIKIAREMDGGWLEGQFDIVSTVPVPDDELAEERAALGIYDEDSCSECGEALDLDGYDGKCGNCCDAEEAQATEDETIAVLPDGTITDWDERLRMVDAAEVAVAPKPERKPVPFQAKYWLATYGGAFSDGLDVEFYEDEQLFNEAIANVESNHDAGDIDNFTHGDVPTEVWK